MKDALKTNDFIRDDTKDLVAFAEMGEYPCQYCKEGERPGCHGACRAWPIWFSRHWKQLQKELKRGDNLWV